MISLSIYTKIFLHVNVLKKKILIKYKLLIINNRIYYLKFYKL